MQIKKSRLMQIIKEELSRIEEVEVVRRGGGLERQLFQDYVAAEGDMERSAIMRKLAPILTKKIVTHLMSKNIATMTASDAEDIAQDEISRLADNPSVVDLEMGLPSTFLKRNALNTAIDRFRQVKKVGGTPSATGEISQMSDIAQAAGETLPTDIMRGSRFPSPEAVTVARDAYAKLQKEDPEAATAFMLSYWGHTNNEIGELLGVSQPTVSRAVSKARELMTTMEEAQSLEEGTAELRKFGKDKIAQIRAMGKEKGKSKVDIEYHVDMVKGIVDSGVEYDRPIDYVARVVNDKMPEWAMKGKPTAEHGPEKTGPIDEVALEEVISEVLSELVD